MSEQTVENDVPACWNNRDGCLANCESVCVIADPAPSDIPPAEKGGA